MPNADGEVAMNEAHEKLRELLVAIRSVLTKYKECDNKYDDLNLLPCLNIYCK